MTEQTQAADYNILVADSHVSRIGEVVDALKAAGFQVSKVAPQIGTVSGSIDPERAEGLRSIAGVETVLPNRTFKAI